MKILCLSTSNSRKDKEESVSSKVCEIIKTQLMESSLPNLEVKSCTLQDFNLMPCDLCGACSNDFQCPYDEAFNALFKEMITSDGIFFVVPHYSPLPSKLVILFEKMNEFQYGAWLTQSKSAPRFQEITVGLVGHGGMTETPEVLEYYHEHIVMPVSRTLRSLGFKVAKLDSKHGVTFGLENESCLAKSDTSIFPNIIINESMIQPRIKSLLDAFKEQI